MDKRIYFVISPHINYYHSYRGDSKGKSGFFKDLKIMEGILNQLDVLESEGFSNGKIRLTWDYADIFWSIQLQKEYQNEVLDRVIERCKKGKDEVLIGSWANIAQAILDTEELRKDNEWFLSNSMEIGVNQLFKGRVAPYSRVQEMMFTQGMIEQYNRLGIKGICLYYSAVPFDAGRPFLNPRLTLDQRYGLVKLRSTVSDATITMIPTYSFGDIYDYLSIKKWFELIRKQQISGEISGHALIFLNFDMDYDNWVGIKMPKKLEWMPNTRGIRELAEAVDDFKYIEFTNLLDIIPKLKIYGETTLYQDVADGAFNGFYNWAQKFDNTKFWTIGQRARWMKCISDTLIENDFSTEVSKEANKFLRDGNDLSQTYLKNKLLFCSTTNFGMSVPFLHPDRHKTALTYGLNAHIAAENAVNLTVDKASKKIFESLENNQYYISIIPIVNRGITETEKTNVNGLVFIKTELPGFLKNLFLNKNYVLKLVNQNDEKLIFNYSTYKSESNSELFLEGFIPASHFNEKRININKIIIEESNKDVSLKNQELEASTNVIKNEFISLRFDANGKISSFKYNEEEIGCPTFLETAVTFGKQKKNKRYTAKKEKITVIRDGTDSFSASVKVNSEFEIVNNSIVYSEKILTLYSNIPYLFVNVKVKFPEIHGIAKNQGITSAVETSYDQRWNEIMPCEIKPNILGNGIPLRIWKRNFFGYVSSFDLNLRDVDPKNADVDCLVSNVSDGWMAMSNKKTGLLIGFNSLKAANFAFSPIKIRNKGFGDVKIKSQQIRVNPFGCYYGKLLHHWTDGTGHAQKLVAKQFSTFRSTAPTYSGKKVSFDLVLAPYFGDQPPLEVQSFSDHFSLQPLVLIGKKNASESYTNISKYVKKAEKIIDKFNLRESLNLSYLKRVKKINENSDGSEEVEDELDISSLGLKTLLRLYFDGRKGR